MVVEDAHYLASKYIPTTEKVIQIVISGPDCLLMDLRIFKMVQMIRTKIPQVTAIHEVKYIDSLYWVISWMRIHHNLQSNHGF